MVRDAARRKLKYEAKVDADVARSRILAQKDLMVANAEGAFANLAQMEDEIKAAIMGTAKTVYSILIPAYLNVGRELWKKSQKFSGITFAAEAKLVVAKWTSRGLDADVLDTISALFNVAPA